jgi:hypothetical protein
MISTNNTKPSPIEVWLTQKNLDVTCMVVKEDETTSQLDVDSLSMRGAQREVTGYLIAAGYSPIGRWQYDENAAEDMIGRESMRRFAPKVTYYVIAELDEDGKPVSYLNAIAAEEFAPDPTYRLTAELGHAWKSHDAKNAQKHADAFNSDGRNPHLTVIERPAGGPE